MPYWKTYNNWFEYYGEPLNNVHIIITIITNHSINQNDFIHYYVTSTPKSLHGDDLRDLLLLRHMKQFGL